MKEFVNFIVLAVLIIIAIVLSMIFGPLYVIVAIGVAMLWELVLFYTAYKNKNGL